MISKLILKIKNDTWSELIKDNLIKYCIDNLNESDLLLILRELANKPNKLTNSFIGIGNYYRYIQSYISEGRICPYCNKFFNSYLNIHMKECHNKTKEDYILDLNNLTELPKCSNPECDNKVHFRNYGYTIYCSLSCRTKHRNSSPTNPWKIWDPESTGLSKEICDEHNDDLYKRNSRLGYETGSSPTGPWKIWDPESTGLSKEICDEHNERKLRTSIENLIHKGTRIHCILNNNEILLRSYWEFYTLLWLRIRCNYSPNNIIYEKDVNGYRPDFYIKSLDRYIECHYSYDNKLIKYSKLNIKWRWYNESRVINIKNKLYKLIPYLMDELSKYYLYDKSFSFNFDTLSITSTIIEKHQN